MPGTGDFQDAKEPVFSGPAMFFVADVHQPRQDPGCKTTDEGTGFCSAASMLNGKIRMRIERSNCRDFVKKRGQRAIDCTRILCRLPAVQVLNAGTFFFGGTACSRMIHAPVRKTVQFR
jgi:hypothetical protein